MKRYQRLKRQWIRLEQQQSNVDTSFSMQRCCKLSLQSTLNTHETCCSYMPKRKVSILPKLFSLFCICWTAEAAEAPPCNPEPPGPESSCLQAGWDQALLEGEQSSTATREDWEKKGGNTGKQNTGAGARASCSLPSGVTRRPELYEQGDAGSEWQDDKELLPLRGAATT